jgi:hypothetical protein
MHIVNIERAAGLSKKFLRVAMPLVGILALSTGGMAGFAQTASGTSTPATATDRTVAAPPETTANSKSDKGDGSAKAVENGQPVQAGTLHAQRKAAKLYLHGVKLLEQQRPDEAWSELKQAAALDPANQTYARAAELARQSTVTQLVQEAVREHVSGSGKDSAALLQQALQIDPTNASAIEHLHQLSDESGYVEVGKTASSEAPENRPITSELIELKPNSEKHDFHLNAGAKQVIQQVFKSYGVIALIDRSVQNTQVRFDIDDASFTQATHALGLVTKSFWEALDQRRVVVAQDTRANRQQFQRTQMETIYLPALVDKDLTDVNNLAKNVFDAQQAAAGQTSGTLTVRASGRTLQAFNHTVEQLEDGKSQVDLNVRIIQLAHVSARETGTTFFQQTGVYNVFSEIQSVLSQNQAAVQQIISSGLVANDNTLANQIAILAILVASGQLSGTPFNQGFLPFGGGLTQSLLVPGPATLTMSLNSSDTRVLDDIHMRLQNDEKGTFKVGERYPIETSAYSAVSLPNIPGLSSAVAGAQSQEIPQVQYQDIGLTVTATPNVMRSNDVALTVDFKIDSLGGSALNGIPILNSQQFSGVLTLQQGETAVMISDLSRQESRALSGLPGVSDIPGLQDISDIQKNQNVARLLILVTPSVVRDLRTTKRSPMLMVDKSLTAH